MSAFPPPPTNNALSKAQRSQLLRTTKKLGHVLGSTPCLPDPIDTSYPPRPSTSSHSSREPSPTDRPVLRLPTPGPTPAERPLPPIPAPSERVAKMERVRRRLGDGVPVELVFPSKSKPTSSRRAKSVSMGAPHPFGGPRTPLADMPVERRTTARDDTAEVPLLRERRREQRREYFVKGLVEPVGSLGMGMRC